MDERAKRRLVGGVILLSLASILTIWAVSNQSGANNFIWLDPVPPSFSKIVIDENIKPTEFDNIQETLDDLKSNIKGLAANNQPVAKASSAKSKDNVKNKPVKKSNNKDKPKNKVGRPNNPLDEITFNSNSIPTRWVVQAGSFTTENDAIKEKKRLASHEFVSVVRASRSSKNGNIIYAVYVGPFLQESRAQENRQALKEKLKLEGNIRKWE